MYWMLLIHSLDFFYCIRRNFNIHWFYDFKNEIFWSCDSNDVYWISLRIFFKYVYYYTLPGLNSLAIHDFTPSWHIQGVLMVHLQLYNPNESFPVVTSKPNPFDLVHLSHQRIFHWFVSRDDSKDFFLF